MSNNTYTKENYELLCKIISLFKKIVITPHILAETSNLTRLSRGIRDQKLLNFFKVFIDFLQNPLLEERHVKISNFFDIKVDLISSFGFTDIAMFELSRSNNMAIITDDGPFYGYATSGKIPAINFQHVINSHFNTVFLKI